jgi:5-methylcytosine-specific restriction protein A
MDEFDELGRDPFLAKYGYGHAKRYFVRRNGKLYDSKAIAGVAVGFQYPDRGPMLNSEFSGGEGSVVRRLGIRLCGPGTSGRWSRRSRGRLAPT